MVTIKIDKDMLLTELYELRAAVTAIGIETDETLAARQKVDAIVNLVSNAPTDEKGTRLPFSARGGR